MIKVCHFFLVHILYIFIAQLEMRDYELTEKEMVKVKRLLMDVEAISQQAKIYVEAAEKGPESLPSEIETYRREQRVSEWNVSRAVGKGAGVGAALGK